MPYGTSQKCSKCNMIVKKTLAIRTHRCHNCGLKVDRDYNASLNIKQLGLTSLLQVLKEVTPVEIEQIQNSFRVLQARSLKQDK
jgi:transposase